MTATTFVPALLGPFAAIDKPEWSWVGSVGAVSDPKWER